MSLKMSRKTLVSSLFVTGNLALCVGCGSSTTADTTPPKFVNATLSAETLGKGNELVVTIKASEALSDQTQVYLALPTARPLTQKTATDTDRVYSYTTTGDEGDGEVLVKAKLTDAAGNPSDEVGLGSVRFDFTAPTMTPENNGAKRYLNQGATGVLSFHVSEMLSAKSEATFVESGALNGTALRLAQNGTPLVSYTFTASATGTEPEGPTKLNIKAIDALGNSTTLGPFDGFVFDFTAPTLDTAQAPTLSADTLSLTNKDTLLVTFAATETLAKANVALTPKAGGNAVDLAVSGATTPLAFRAERQVNAMAPFATGLWEVWVTLTDLAGNRTSQRVGVVSLVD
jgi:hypothetical protein